jgi:PilZ domain
METVNEAVVDSGHHSIDDWTMAESKRERRDHFRGKPRSGRRVQVRYRVLDHGQVSEEHRAFTKNVGICGAFILTTDPAPPGASVQLILEVPTQRPIEIHGDVRWIVDGKHDEPAGEHGMGIKFSPLDVDQLLALNEYFASLTATLDIDEA